jgi:hypothetical protein
MYLKPKRPRSSHGDFTSSTQNVPVLALDRAETTNGRKGREADAPTKSPVEGGNLLGTLKDRCRIPQQQSHCLDRGSRGSSRRIPWLLTSIGYTVT